MAAAHVARDDFSRGNGAPTFAEFLWALQRTVVSAGTLGGGRTRAPLRAYSVVTFQQDKRVCVMEAPGTHLKPRAATLPREEHQR